MTRNDIKKNGDDIVDLNFQSLFVLLYLGFLSTFVSFINDSILLFFTFCLEIKKIENRNSQILCFFYKTAKEEY